jgi:methyl-accepting chemotaxis protein
MCTLVSQYRIRQSDHISAATPAQKARNAKLMRAAQAAIEGKMADYEKLANAPDQKAAIAHLKQDWGSYTGQNTQLLALSGSDAAAAKALFEGDLLTAFYTVEDDILQLIDLNTKGANAVSARSATIYAQARRFIIGGAVAGVLVALAMLALMMASVARPILRMSEAVARLVEGDLHVELPATAATMNWAALPARSTVSRRCSPPTSSAPPPSWNAPAKRR